jgi:hypothetical protein
MRQSISELPNETLTLRECVYNIVIGHRLCEYERDILMSANMNLVWGVRILLRV